MRNCSMIERRLWSLEVPGGVNISSGRLRMVWQRLGFSYASSWGESTYLQESLYCLESFVVFARYSPLSLALLASAFSLRIALSGDCRYLNGYNLPFALLFV
jgi:hypothetical protein